jgi:murein DD-endopeptidase MepM/ murein hydrolase activator NlpD
MIYPKPILPLEKPLITSPYGPRPLPTDPLGENSLVTQLHTGIDMISDDRTVHAILSGVVVYDHDDYRPQNRWNRKSTDSLGRVVIVRHILRERVHYVRYCHLEINYVSVGDALVQGSAIGRYGDYGYSIGAHLHIDCYDTHWNKRNIAEVFWPDNPALQNINHEE